MSLSAPDEIRKYLNDRSCFDDIPLAMQYRVVEDISGIVRRDMMGNWLPIESAPKDRRILAYGILGLEDASSIGTVKWNGTYSHWQCDPNEASEYDPEKCEVTHWMPLPEPPK